MDKTIKEPGKVPQGEVTPTEPKKSPKPAKPESRTKVFLRKAFRWTLLLAIFFMVGALAAVFVLYKPSQSQLVQIRSQLTAADQQIDEMMVQSNQQKSDYDANLAEISALEDRNQELQEDLNLAILHATILSARTDATLAQLALEQNDAKKAGMVLSKTHDKLITIDGLLDSGQSDAIEDLQDRLELVIDELDNNVFAARSDLDVLVNSLLELEVTYFAEP